MSMFRRTPSITPQQAADAHARGELVIVDVREPTEVAAVAIAGSRQIPLGHLPDGLAELRGAAPAFVCASGARSKVAVAIAAREGIDAVNVAGGLEAWLAAGLALDGASDYSITHTPKEAA